jgi:hypothetical protein
VAPAISLCWYNNLRSSAGDRGFEFNLGGHRTAALALGMPSPVEFNAEWGNTVIARPLVPRSLHVLSWVPRTDPSYVLLITLLFLL